MKTKCKSPLEEAKEIFEAFYSELPKESAETAKKCFLVAIDLLIKKINGRNDVLQYLEQIKTEIKKQLGV